MCISIRGTGMSVAANLARFCEAVADYVEQYKMPIFCGCSFYPEIPPGWVIESRKRDEFYACAIDGFNMQYLLDERGLDKVFLSYEYAVEAIQQAYIADAYSLFPDGSPFHVENADGKRLM
jgi:hypothetical protein